MDLGGGELQDWELLQNSNESTPINSPKSVEVNSIIRSNYFSFDSQEGSVSLIDHEIDGKGQLGGVEKDEIQVGFGGTVDQSENFEMGVGDHVKTGSGGIEVGFGGIGEILAEEGYGRSDDPSWDDPQYWMKGSVLSDDCKFDGKTQLGVVGNDEIQVGFGGIGEIVDETGNIGVGVGEHVNSASDRSDGCKFDGKDEFGVVGDIISDKGFVRSDNPSWIDPCFEIEYSMKRRVLSDDFKFGEFEDKNESGVIEKDKIEGGFGRIEEILAEEGSFRYDDPNWIEPELETHYPTKDSSEVLPDSLSDRSDELNFGQVDDVGNEKIQVDFQGTEENVVGSESIHENLREEREFSGNENVENVNNEIVSVVAKSGGEEEKRSMVWWKFPLEFLKYCVFKVNPIWTISVAAAVMGFAILGRRLYMMKRKSRSLQINVTVDDKKISQVMSRVARLNEAFSIVRRVPMVRPSLPAAGMTPWPVMSLR